SFKTVGDVEFYTRLITQGVRFKKSLVPRGAFYINPHGLSQAWYNKPLVQHELQIWRERYAHINRNYRIPCS
ncbi:MAG TPA: hypothetical protein VHA52_01265, partial [Candidatus Babeliaceae bacterium]|nr:hypothetical protein [Candidatus Babeliaceae bacterium]